MMAFALVKERSICYHDVKSIVFESLGVFMNQTANPLLGNRGVPHFDLIKPEHIVPAVEQVLKDCEQRFSKLEAECKPSWEGLFEPLAQIGLLVHETWSPISHLNGVMNSEELRKPYEQMQGEVVKLGLRMNQSEPIYRTMKELRDGDGYQSLSEGQKRILNSRINDAELSGIGLSGDARKEFNAFAQELTQLSTQFSNNVLDATKAFSLVLKTSEETFGLPLSYLNMASHAYNEKFNDQQNGSPEKGPWLVTLDYPSFVPFMENSKNRGLRKKLYLAFITRASDDPYDNKDTIRRILQIRKNQSKLLGFESYAEMSLSRKMAGSVDEIYKLEEELREASWDVAKNELEELKSLAKENGEEDLMNWDIAFWAKRLQEKKFQFTDEELRPYFPLPRVLEGLFSLVEKIFGIKVESADGEVATWHKDVRFFKIFDENKTHIASFFLDPYSRPMNKRGGAWMDECVPRYKKDGETVLPVAYLVCNSTPPVDTTPSLMTFREVETLFHEFGHGLQHMLTTIDLVEASGINGIEWDAIELPSQFMENWCYHKTTLMGLAKHYKSNESLPEDLFNKLVASKTFRAAQLMLRQIQFGLLDLELHHNYDPFSKKTPFDVQKDVAKKTSVLSPLEQDFFLCSFSHIFSGGYAAGYYSYKWAEVLSSDAFAAFEEAGLDDESSLKRVGREFRDTILSLGGSQHPLEVFKKFRKRGPSTKPLLRHSGLSN